MINLIPGKKGTGKTKVLVDAIKVACENATGNVVCIEKGTKLRFDVKYQARLIDVNEYDIMDAHGLQGFVAGLYASNSDITDIYVDAVLKICANDIEAFAAILPKLSKLTEGVHKLRFVFDGVANFSGINITPAKTIIVILSL